MEHSLCVQDISPYAIVSAHNSRRIACTKGRWKLNVHITASTLDVTSMWCPKNQPHPHKSIFHKMNDAIVSKAQKLSVECSFPVTLFYTAHRPAVVGGEQQHVPMPYSFTTRPAESINVTLLLRCSTV
jgi:hypothetical protein